MVGQVEVHVMQLSASDAAVASAPSSNAMVSTPRTRFVLGAFLRIFSVTDLKLIRQGLLERLLQATMG